MMNIKIILILVAALVVVGGGYVMTRKTDTTGVAAPTISATSAVATVPSPQYLHDHPSELADAKVKCDRGTAPQEPYCTNVHKAEELVEVDEYKKAVGSANPK